MEFTITLTLGQLFVGTGVVLGAIGVGWRLYFSSLLSRLAAFETALASINESIEKRINQLQVASNAKVVERLNPLTEILEGLNSEIKRMQDKVHSLDKDVGILQDRHDRNSGGKD